MPDADTATQVELLAATECQLLTAGKVTVDHVAPLSVERAAVVWLSATATQVVPLEATPRQALAAGKVTVAHVAPLSVERVAEADPCATATQVEPLAATRQLPLEDSVIDAHVAPLSVERAAWFDPLSGAVTQVEPLAAIEAQKAEKGNVTADHVRPIGGRVAARLKRP